MSDSDHGFSRPIQTINLHFAADGTQIGDQKSRLFRRFDRIANRRAWRAQIVKAFRVWGQILGVKVRVGRNSRQQFGARKHSNLDGHVDVQIGARELSRHETGLSFGAQDRLAGNWAGKVIFNSKARYRSLRDIYSVALHEAGHILGLPHDNHVESIMNPNGNAEAIVSPRDRRTLVRLVNRYRVRRRDISSIKDVKGDWALSQDFQDLARNKRDFGVSYQRRFTNWKTNDPRLFRVPGVNLKLDDPTLTISLEQLGTSSAGNSRVRLFDEDGDALEHTTVSRQQSSITIQTEEIDPRESYFVRVDSADANGRHRFALTAEYASEEVELNRVFRGRLNDDEDRQYHTLKVARSRLLNLGIVAWDGDENQSVYMLLRNRRGNIVETFSVTPNEINDARTVWLNPGRYSIEVLTTNESEQFERIRYDILADDPTRPGGPGLVDPTLKPLGQTPGIPGLDLTLNEQPTVLTADTNLSTLWHGASSTGTLRWLGLGGSTGLLSSF